MALIRAVVYLDMGAKSTPTGKLPKRERERLIEGIEDCLSRAPAGLDVWHAEIIDLDLAVASATDSQRHGGES